MDLDDLFGDLDLDRAHEVVEALWERKDELVAIVATLPDLLGDVGQQLQEAGGGAQRAGAFLAEDVPTLTTKAADALDDSHGRIEAVADVLRGLGGLLDDLPLVGDAGDVVADGLKALGGVADDVADVAGQLRGLGERLGAVGGDLDGMGASLGGGGAALAAFTLDGAGGGRSRSGKAGGVSTGGKSKAKTTKAKTTKGKAATGKGKATKG